MTKKPQNPLEFGGVHITSVDADDEIIQAFKKVAKMDYARGGKIRSVLKSLILDYLSNEGAKVFDDNKKKMDKVKEIANE